MDAAALQSSSSPSSPSSPSKLRDKLRTTVCCCFGAGGSGSGGSAERARWRRGRGAAAGEFRYDALSYALNFDEGDDDDAYADPAAAFRYRNFNARLTPSPAAGNAVGAQRPRASAIATAIA